MRVLHEVQGVDRIVDDVAEQVADSGWPDYRDEEIRARTDAIAAQRVAERAQVMRQAGGASDVDHPANADRGIGDETDRRRARPRGPQLQHVVDEHHRLAEVDEHIVDGLADRPWRERSKKDANDSQPAPGEGLLDGEPVPVETLERIVGRRGCVGDGPEQAQQQAGGGHSAAR
jgi:hypothetical protein